MGPFLVGDQTHSDLLSSVSFSSCRVLSTPLADCSVERVHIPPFQLLATWEGQKVLEVDLPSQDRSLDLLRNSIMHLSMRRWFLNSPLYIQFIESPWVASIPPRALICKVMTQSASLAQNFLSDSRSTIRGP